MRKIVLTNGKQEISYEACSYTRFPEFVEIVLTGGIPVHLPPNWYIKGEEKPLNGCVVKMVGNDLEIDGIIYKFHHTSLASGYVNRKLTFNDCIKNASVYTGRFGRGYTVDTPNYNTTRYCYRTYYIGE